MGKSHSNVTHDCGNALQEKNTTASTQLFVDAPPVTSHHYTEQVKPGILIVELGHYVDTALR